MSDQILDENYDDLDGEPRLYRFAGFWIRVGASIVDILVMIPLIGLSFYILLVLKSLPLIIITTIITAAYKPLMEYQYGATLGKMAVGVKVINEDGGLLTPNQAIIRYMPWLIGNIVNLLVLVEVFAAPGFEEVEGFMEYNMFVAQNPSTLTSISSAVGLLVLVSVIFLLFNKQKQALHDKWANTFCIYKD